ncbi:MAG: hypothetical protein AB1664_00675 [Thermodesulfobacteriota bacterium]
MAKPKSKKKTSVAKKAPPSRKPARKARLAQVRPRASMTTPQSVDDDLAVVSLRMILGWTYHMCGFSNIEIADAMRIHRNTVSLMIKRVTEMIQQEVDIDTIRSGLLRLLPHAMGGLQVALDRGDAVALRDYFGEMKIYLGKGAPADGSPLNLNININELREKNQREGLAKLNVAVDRNMD